MATTQSIANFRTAAAAVAGVDRARLLRASLGEASKKAVVEPLLAEIGTKIALVSEAAESVPTQQLDAMTQHLNNVHSNLSRLAAADDVQYLQNGDNWLQGARAHLQELGNYWTFVISALVERRGLLNTESLDSRVQAAKAELHAIEEQLRARLDAESKKVVEEARVLAARIQDQANSAAEQIKGRARDTARGVSLDGAQKQFADAESIFKRQVKSWSYISGAAAALLLSLAGWFVFQPPPNNSTADAIYHVGVRLTVLASAAAFLAFSLRILRSQLHMLERNRHRQRIANAMPSLLDAVSTDPERDITLRLLVSSVADFGDSGLVVEGADAILPVQTVLESVRR